jgi:LysR family nitrogen assimilation transcriptional regulator
MPMNFEDQDWHPDLRTLRYVICDAEEKSMTKAAGRLRIAQPALSRQISKLEKDLDAAVFSRLPRGVELTEIGEILLERSYSIFSQLAQTYRDVKTHSTEPKGIVVVGMPPTPGEFILPALLARIKRDYPQIALRIVEGFSRDLEKGLRSGNIALAVMHDPPDSGDIVGRELLRERLNLIGPPGSLNKDAYTLAEAVALPLIMPPRPNFLRVLVDRAVDQSGLILDIVQRVDGVWHLKALVRAGHGFSILTYGAVLTEVEQGTLVARPIVDPIIEWRLCVATRIDHKGKPAFAAVENAICDIVDDLVARGVWR